MAWHIYLSHAVLAAGSLPPAEGTTIDQLCDDDEHLAIWIFNVFAGNVSDLNGPEHYDISGARFAVVGWWDGGVMTANGPTRLATYYDLSRADGITADGDGLVDNDMILGLGRLLTETDQPYLDVVNKEWLKDGATPSIPRLIHGLVSTETFRYRRGEGT